MPLITVFTPTYNRKTLLPRLFDSLCAQSFTDFEWLIVDDGSRDGTEEVISECKKKATFPIVYLKKENGGKHTAINLGLKKAKGDLFFIADSDDMLTIDSLETISSNWESIKDDERFCGICGLDGDLNGDVIGSGLPTEMIDASALEIRYKFNVTGDMKEVYRTDVLKEYPFPEISGEHFCPEALIWNRIAQKYRMLYLNKIVYIAEYQPTGISSQIIKMRMKSPVASALTYQELTTYKDVPGIVKIKAAINYWRFRCCIRHEKLKGLKHLRGFFRLMAPAGIIMHWTDIRRTKKS